MIQITDIEGQIFEFDNKKEEGQENSICPACDATRKHKGAHSFSWSHDKKAGLCRGCNKTFFLPKTTVTPQADLDVNDQPLTEEMLKWFHGRGISTKTLEDWWITGNHEYIGKDGKEVDTINFNYFDESGYLINIKSRSLSKGFSFVKGYNLTMYGLYMLEKEGPLIINEGEIDTLTLYEIGYRDVLSVPNGASRTNNNLEYIEECLPFINDYKEIIIMTDNDEPGDALRADLIKLLGSYRCKTVNMGMFNDANQVFIEAGEEVLRSIVENPIEIDQPDDKSLSDFSDEHEDLVKNGLVRGYAIDVEILDDMITYLPGYVYTITGFTSHGKSELTDFVALKLITVNGLKASFYSPENWPVVMHVDKIVSKVGNRSERLEIKEKIGNNIRFIVNDELEELSLDEILDVAKYQVMKYGINILVIDPYNRVKHDRQSNETETEYVNKFMGRLTRFARRYQVILFLVAHPTKPNDTFRNSGPPSIYSISGSSNFANATDFGITVYREKDSSQQYTGETHIICTKARLSHVASPGLKVMKFSDGRYYDSKGRIDDSNWLDNSKI